ncbi:MULTISPECIES: hypothetical protein [unclassified Streptomyces]|uniref:hypothetical protein n=1 Tax=unclassified Streptomyces TaxID=2593676 RepID=UPI002E10E8EB|nr:hypothetical protein OG452_24850 [Streptomyces sp. NBC_01197]WSS49018.1 hypothetical protein OG708_10395 [Streptomyces sp. NBC_01180]
MSAPTQDPTPWELLRAMQQMRDDLRSDFADFASRLAEMVTKEAYTADRRTDELRLRALESDLADVKAERDRELSERSTNRRLAISAIIAPIVVALITTWLIAGQGK